MAGTSKSLNPPIHDYATPGGYTITLSITDDVTPTANTLVQTAEVVLTESSRESSGGAWNTGWRVNFHVRRVADLNQDGFDDVIRVGDIDTYVQLGSATGLQPGTIWSTGNWVTNIYAGAETDPRFFVDIDKDGDLDIVGVDASTNTVRYGLNNGSGFDAPVDWITGIGWNATYDAAYLVDVDNDQYPDFVHAKKNGSLTVYTSNGASLDHSAAIVDSNPWSSVYPDRKKYPIVASDMDGDGCTDLILFGTTSTWAKRSTCDGNWDMHFQLLPGGLDFGSGWRTELHHREVTDLNNDGKPDIIGFGTADVFVYINKSTTGNIALEQSAVWSGQFVSSQGWAMEKIVIESSFPSFITRLWYNIHPRYLTDVNGDGYKDVVGYASAGAFVLINKLGVDRTAGFAPYYHATPEFLVNSSTSGTAWWENTSCAISSTCREFFPRLVGDFNGDSHTDFLGFDQTGIVYQPSSYVTQFK